MGSATTGGPCNVKRPEQVLLAVLYVNSIRLRTSTSGVELFATILASRDSTYVWNRLSYAVSSRRLEAEDCLHVVPIGQTSFSAGRALSRRVPGRVGCGVATVGGAAGEQSRTKHEREMGTETGRVSTLINVFGYCVLVDLYCNITVALLLAYNTVLYYPVHLPCYYDR